uniref:Uncharacterized protein n=1 Tax=Biomphalaria glabrata TaxID=6526 RepID=A0A2C9LHP2_BIOGL
MARQEADEMSERVHQKSQLQEAQHRASAMSREVQVLRHSLEATKLQLQQLQETLAARENAHREELSTRYKLNSPDLQQIIQEKVKNAERSFQAEQTKQQERSVGPQLKLCHFNIHFTSFKKPHFNLCGHSIFENPCIDLFLLVLKCIAIPGSDISTADISV